MSDAGRTEYEACCRDDLGVEPEWDSEPEWLRTMWAQVAAGTYQGHPALATYVDARRAA